MAYWYVNDNQVDPITQKKLNIVVKDDFFQEIYENDVKNSPKRRVFMTMDEKNSYNLQKNGQPIKKHKTKSRKKNIK